MSLKDKIQIIVRQKIVDEHGWFLKIINGKEDFLPGFTGEIYLISANEGECRANHYHLEANEWFTLVKGKAEMIIEDVKTNERLTILLDAEQPQTIFIPNNIAHAFKNSSNEPYILVVYSDKLYNPKDTISFQF